MMMIDQRREVALFSSEEEAIQAATTIWLDIAEKSLKERGRCSIALSGGSTPQAIYRSIAKNDRAHALDWSRIFLFFSDERAVPLDSTESNFYNGCKELSSLPIPDGQIFPFDPSLSPEESANAYEAIIDRFVPDKIFDLVMVGVGEDGHTASLFPEVFPMTKSVEKDLLALWIPSLQAWRFSFSLRMIHRARKTIVYAFGRRKATIVHALLREMREELPAYHIGTVERPALWILDGASGEKILPIQHLA